jgi:hypothetical protein
MMIPSSSERKSCPSRREGVKYHKQQRKITQLIDTQSRSGDRKRKMRVKQSVDGCLVLEGDLDEATDEAFIEGRLVEAFALLQGYVDWLVADLYRLYRAIGLGENIRELESMRRENLSWEESLNRLIENKIITKEEFDRLRKFNESRNKIVQTLILASAHQTRKERVTREEAFEGFLNAKEMIFLLKGRSKSLTLRSQDWYEDETDHKLGS